MMKNISICLLDRDAYFAKAFMETVALDHPGYSVKARAVCTEDCKRDMDVCIGFGPDTKGIDSEYNRYKAHIPHIPQIQCEKAFIPACGRHSGVSAILREARIFVFDHIMDGGKAAGLNEAAFKQIPELLQTRTLVCVYAYAGGLGTSVAAIGIGRELARYRGERALYLSLEDVEDPGLFPAGVCAMRAEEVLYRYLRILNGGVDAEALERLFHSAAVRDEYGLYRLAPDDGPGCLARLAPTELYGFLTNFACALKLTRIVLDFGTRLHQLSAFAALSEEDETLLVEAVSENENDTRKRKGLFETDKRLLAAVFPYCKEDVRQMAGKTDVGLANAFGIAVKEICDRIVGEGYERGRKS